MFRTKTAEYDKHDDALSIASDALLSFESVVADLTHSSELLQEVEDDARAEAARQQSKAEQAYATRERNQAVASRIQGLLSGDQ